MNKKLVFWRKFKAFMGHRLILELAIIGSFIVFTINPGSLGDLMRICGAIFLINVLFGSYRIGDVTEGHLVVLGIFLITLLINAFMPDEMIHRRSFRYFWTLPGMILAIHCLSKRENPDSRTLLFYSCIAVLALIIQFIAYHTVESVVNSGGLESYGLSGNMHHFGSFASIHVHLRLKVRRDPYLDIIKGKALGPRDSYVDCVIFFYAKVLSIFTAEMHVPVCPDNPIF